MVTHLTARLSWHMNGWNGHICSDPASNRFCVGAHSYPADQISNTRDLKWESKFAGKPCQNLDKIPPCRYSINAFGGETLRAFNDPPPFYETGQRTFWSLPPATVCVWPYEVMYNDGAKTNGRFDYDKRLSQAQAFFNEIENEKSLVFHYANYSNPFSDEDVNRYAVIGMSRVKKVGNIMFYDGTDEATKNRFGGAYIWQVNVETHYPDQGFRIPYHQYSKDDDILEKIAVFPENTRCFKYVTRHVSDDNALSILERFVEVATFLQHRGDNSENWIQRIQWLNSVIVELWKSRGLYPGFSRVLDLIGLGELVGEFRKAVELGQERDFLENTNAWLIGNTECPPVQLKVANRDAIRRQWNLREEDERRLLMNTLPRYDLSKEQIERIIGNNRSANGLDVNLNDIIENPYLLSEQFVGNEPDDVIPFSSIDHGIYPSPDIGEQLFSSPDDPHRLRALCVDRLKFETRHTFMSCGQMLEDVNSRISSLPDWKRAEFTERHLEVDKAVLEPALVLRREESQSYAYLRSVYKAEREIESNIRKLTSLPDISFTAPLTETHWKELLFDADSTLVEKDRCQYEKAIAAQAEVCAEVFNRPLSIICGSAGTGKTTIIDAIIAAIEKTHGSNATVLLLAPTGKAADRIRQKTNRNATTIHSFLAKNAWLNDNRTFKTTGGKKEDSIANYVIDEASMLDLELTASLFRAIHPNSIQRFILVGDPNQLPPIGKGRVFADTITWLRQNYPNSVGELKVNLRQMENRLTGKGTGILDLATLYIRDAGASEEKYEKDSSRAEEMFQRLQDLPSDGEVDKDLRLVYWHDSEDLMDKLVQRIISDMEEDTGQKYDPNSPYKIWLAPVGSDQYRKADYHQVITPYRHEPFGTTAINERIQRESHGGSIDRIGQIAGITLFDKVIQYRNRGAIDRIWAM